MERRQCPLPTSYSYPSCGAINVVGFQKNLIFHFPDDTWNLNQYMKTALISIVATNISAGSWVSRIVSRLKSKLSFLHQLYVAELYINIYPPIRSMLQKKPFLLLRLHRSLQYCSELTKAWNCYDLPYTTELKAWLCRRISHIWGCVLMAYSANLLAEYKWNANATTIVVAKHISVTVYGYTVTVYGFLILRFTGFRDFSRLPRTS